MKHFCIIGDRLSHSKSPFFYNYLFQKYNVPAIYETCELPELNESVFQELKQKYAGFNVTSPYKEVIVPFLDELDESASVVNAVNVVVVREGKAIGYNTDYLGFKESFLNLNLNLPYDARIFILGTGGAGKVCYAVLTDLGYFPHFVTRTKKGPGFFSYSALKAKKSADLLINATPLGLDNKSNPINFPFKSKYAIDLIYNPPLTPFLKQFNSHFNGLEMFLYQALKTVSIFGFSFDIDLAEIKTLITADLDE